ncbi:MAG TPA: hypothetical protein VMU83_21725 [Hanamia sp.]|nr:hypothetical protein [Hanamia sp.]
MKQKITTLVALSSLLFFSCQKSSNTDQTTNSNKVKTYTESITSPGTPEISDSYNITYDANNRITGVVPTNSSDVKFIFTYSSNSKFSLDLYNAGALSIHEDIFLNSNSLFDSTFQYNDTNDTTTEKYFYNSNNQLVTLKEYDYSKDYGSEISNVTSYSYDSNGNVVETTDTNDQIETFDYYPDLVYAMPFTNPSLNQALNSTKKTSLLKTHTVTSSGYPVGSAISTYTFDSNNRISTITQTTDDGTVVIQTFTYF